MLDLKEQLKILLLYLRQAPGGELGSSTVTKSSLPAKATQAVGPLAELDLNRLLKLANHLQKSQFVELAQTGGLTERDFDRLQWWAQDYQKLAPPSPLSPDQTAPSLLVSANQVKSEVQVHSSLNVEVAGERSEDSITALPNQASARNDATPGSASGMLDRAINKVYHRQKLSMIIPLAIKLRQIKGGEIKVAALDEGYLGLLKEFNQQAASLSQSALNQFGPASGLGERDLVRLLWLRNDFNKTQSAL